MDSEPVFHSKDLKKIKASEKKEYFTNVKKKSNLKKRIKDFRLILILLPFVLIIFIIFLVISSYTKAHQPTKTLKIDFDSTTNESYLDEEEGANG